ncbi:MAG: DUF1365 domain-containing protein [Gordonia sp. (in: high G+C Gram-positive bacteria)]|uniref:DUF1365 domain-containing protein n=1 Tax=Gordonia sp. (in: high G+C Gram-positive bacteria) TaxID=84139 RepID=UPI0039E65194
MSAPVPAMVNARIVHCRTDPLVHRFSYRSRTWLVDLDDLPRLPALLRPFARFRPDDHFPEPAAPGDTLRGRLTAHVRAAGVAAPTGRIIALTSPRVCGYVFNPITVYWCYAADGALEYAIAEVHNTYGGRHCYIVELDDDGHAEVAKEFYVSPFHDVSGTYRIRLSDPADDDRIAVSVALSRPGASDFTATLTGRAQPANTTQIILAQLAAPMAPLVVSARIRLHGIRLWLRGLKINPPPAHDHHSTVALNPTTPKERQDR